MGDVRLATLFLLISIVVINHKCCQAHTQRLLKNNADPTEERFHQLEITIQNLKSQMTGYDNLVIQMQSNMKQMQANIDNLNNEIKTKDSQIANLSSVMTSLRYKVAFMAEITGNYLHPSVGRHLVYDKVYLNEGNGYHSSHGTFTAPLSGLYEFSMAVTAHLGVNTRTHVNMEKNGIAVGYLFFDNLDTGNPWLKESESILVHLDAGDEVWIQVTQSVGSVEIATGSMHTYFSGYLIKVDF